MKTRKTGSKNRTNYPYVSLTGEARTLRPGDKDPVTGETISAEWIALLHRLDDREVYNNVKNTRAPIQRWERPGIAAWQAEHPNESLPTRMHVSIDDVEEDDEADAGYVAKASIAAAENQEDVLLERLHDAVETLDPERRELYRRIIENEEPATVVALDYGIDASAIRHRMATIRKQIEKTIEEI